jgi:hypothetical protein
VEHEPDGTLSTHRELHTDRIIERFGMKDSKPPKIPLYSGYKKRNEVHAALKHSVKYRVKLVHYYMYQLKLDQILQ